MTDPKSNKINPQDISSSDADAGLENFGLKDFHQSQYKDAQWERKSSFNKHVNLVRILALYLGFVLGACIVIVWVGHLLTPESVHFISDNNHATLQNLFVGILAGGVFNQFASKVFKDN